MRNGRKRKPRPAKASRRDIAASAYRRLERMAMRPDDSLFIAAVIVAVAVFTWFVTAVSR